MTLSRISPAGSLRPSAAQRAGGRRGVPRDGVRGLCCKRALERWVVCRWLILRIALEGPHSTPVRSRV